MSRLTSFLRSLSARARVAGFRAALPASPPEHGWGAAVPPLVSRDFPIVVCWSPKAGCTTVLKWFLEHNGLLDEAVAHDPWVHGYRASRLCAGEDYRRQCERLFGRRSADRFIVKVIRNPDLRAVSGYLHLLRWGHEPAWSAGAAVDRWKRQVGLRRQRGLSFRQFLGFLSDERRDGRAIDPHFRPQFEPLQDPLVHAHVPLERLSAGVAELERLFRLRHVDLDRLGGSNHHNPPTDDCGWPDSPATHPAEWRTVETLGVPAPEAFLDPDTLARVREVYRADHEAYGSVYAAPGDAPSAPCTLRTPTGESVLWNLRPMLRGAA